MYLWNYLDSFYKDSLKYVKIVGKFPTPFVSTWGY